MKNIDIDSLTAMNMLTQIRLKQLSTETAQDTLVNKINKHIKENYDNSGEELIKLLKEQINSDLIQLNNANKIFEEALIDDIGIPIKYNKTVIQLNMVKEWVENRGEDLIQDLSNKVFYNKLSNEVPYDMVPQLKSNSNEEFWGNENSSVTTVMLYSISNLLNCKISDKDLLASGTFYPFFNKDYIIDIEENTFIREKGVLLFGDYQFGGRRYFSNEHPNLGNNNIIGPEDCSSSIAKATGVYEEKLSTRAMKEAYDNPKNDYNYQAITSENEGLEIEKINNGDIYVLGGHCAIILDNDNEGNIITAEFNRDIDSEDNKQLGGGTNNYDLLCSVPDKPVYILRRNYTLPLKENANLYQHIHNIDEIYHERSNEYIDNIRCEYQENEYINNITGLTLNDFINIEL